MRTVQIVGGDLFKLALLYLNDCTQWNRIAEANGLVDPVLNGPMTLFIPPVDLSATGGVYGAN